jgi:flagellar protein FliS
MNSTTRYKEIVAETASRERLLVMLFDGALRYIRLGVAALEEGRSSEAATALTRASDIVVELHATLDRARAPQLCDRLAEIYRFVSLRLVAASLEKSREAALEAERVLLPVADGFKQAVSSLAGAQR